MEDLYCWQSKFEPCLYADKLISKIISLKKQKTSNEIDLHGIKKAIFYCKKYHVNQKRLSGEPYYSHPLAVAELVAPYCFKTEILITSILHDTLEDTILIKENLQYIFNPIIAENVSSLTRIKLDRKITAGELLDLLYIQEKEELLLVKYLDRLHNIETIRAKSPEQTLKTIDESLRKFISLGVYLETSIPELFITHKRFLHSCYQAMFNKEIAIEPYPPSIGLIQKASQGNFQLPFLAFRNEKLLS